MGIKKSYTKELNDSIKRVESGTGKKLLDYAVNRAFASDTVLIAILKKIVPDIVKGEGFESTLNNFVVNLKQAYADRNAPDRTRLLPPQEPTKDMGEQGKV